MAILAQDCQRTNRQRLDSKGDHISGLPSAQASVSVHVWWRHEQLSIAAALATVTHHSSQVVTNIDAPRSQKTVTIAGGKRPAPLAEVAGPQGAAATVGYVAAGAPLLLIASLAAAAADGAGRQEEAGGGEEEEEGRGGEGLARVGLLQGRGASSVQSVGTVSGVGRPGGSSRFACAARRTFYEPFACQSLFGVCVSPVDTCSCVSSRGSWTSWFST